VGQRVSSKIAVSTKHLTAGRTFVRFVIRVREKMSLQVAPLIETSGTDRTLVRRLLHVQDLVHRQSATLAEALAAFATFEGLLLTMNIPEEEEGKGNYDFR